MKFNFLITICIVLLSKLASGQQLPIFTQYSEYIGVISPAYVHHEVTGDYKTSIGLAYRDQWTQLPSRPKTIAARYEVKGKERRSGTQLNFGTYYIHDQIGVFSTSDFKARIATSFKIKDDKNGEAGFAAGITVGLVQYRVDLTKIAYAGEDPILFQENTSILAPDAGIGISFYNEFKNKDYFQVAISIPQFLSLDQVYEKNTKEFAIKRIPHFYVVSSYIKALDKKKKSFLSFTGWVKRVENVPIYVDFMARYRFAMNMWLGAGYNNAGILHTEVGFAHILSGDQQFNVGYSFNPTFRGHGHIFGNIHELTFTYLYN